MRNEEDVVHVFGKDFVGISNFCYHHYKAKVLQKGLHCVQALT